MIITMAKPPPLSFLGPARTTASLLWVTIHRLCPRQTPLPSNATAPRQPAEEYLPLRPSREKQRNNVTTRLPPRLQGGDTNTRPPPPPKLCRTITPTRCRDQILFTAEAAVRQEQM